MSMWQDIVLYAVPMRGGGGGAAAPSPPSPFPWVQAGAFGSVPGVRWMPAVKGSLAAGAGAGPASLNIGTAPRALASGRAR